MSGNKEEALVTRKYICMKLEYRFLSWISKKLHITYDCAERKATIHFLIVMDLFAGCVQITDQTLINRTNIEQLGRSRLYIWDSWKPWSLFKLTALTELWVVNKKQTTKTTQEHHSPPPPKKTNPNHEKKQTNKTNPKVLKSSHSTSIWIWVEKREQGALDV